MNIYNIIVVNFMTSILAFGMSPNLRTMIEPDLEILTEIDKIALELVKARTDLEAAAARQAVSQLKEKTGENRVLKQFIYYERYIVESEKQGYGALALFYHLDISNDVKLDCVLSLIKTDDRVLNRILQKILISVDLSGPDDTIDFTSYERVLRNQRHPPPMELIYHMYHTSPGLAVQALTNVYDPDASEEIRAMVESFDDLICQTGRSIDLKEGKRQIIAKLEELWQSKDWWIRYYVIAWLQKNSGWKYHSEFKPILEAVKEHQSDEHPMIRALKEIGQQAERHEKEYNLTYTSIAIDIDVSVDKQAVHQFDPNGRLNLIYNLHGEKKIQNITGKQENVVVKMEQVKPRGELLLSFDQDGQRTPLAYIASVLKAPLTIPGDADIIFTPEKLVPINLTCKQIDQLKQYKSIELRNWKKSKLSLYRFDIQESLPENPDQWSKSIPLMPGIYYLYVTGENENKEEFLGPIAILAEPNKTYDIVFPSAVKEASVSQNVPVHSIF